MKEARFHIFKWTLIFWVALISSHSYSQSVSGFRHFGLEEGLPSMRVYRMLQDHQGFLWLATDAGVSRFDGKRFENFTTLDGLADNDIISIIEDTLGRIWFLPYNGQLSFYSDGQFHNADTDTWLKKIENTDPIIKAVLDGMGRLWLMSSSNGVIRIEGEQAVHLLSNDPKLTSGVADVVEMNDGTILLSCPRLENHIEVEPGIIAGERIMPCSFPFISNSRKSNSHYEKVIEPCGRYLRLCDWGKRQCENIFDFGEPEVINRIEWEGDNEVWVHLAKKGSALFSYEGEKLSLEKNWLNGMSVSDVVIDSKRHKWFSTLDNGIFLENRLNSFSEIISGNGNKFLLCQSNQIILANDQDIWISKAGKDFKKLKSQNQVWKGIIYGEKSQKYFIHSDFWIYSYAPEPEGGRSELVKIPEFENEDNQNLIKSIVEVGRDSLLLGMNTEILLFTKNGLIRKWPIGQEMKGRRITKLYLAKNGDLWAGTNVGIYKFSGGIDGASEKRNEVRGQITAISEDRFGNIWIGTNGNGLYVLESGGKVIVVTASMGLVDDFVREIKINTDSSIWVCTSQGVSVFEANGIEITSVKSFSNRDGLPSPNFIAILVNARQVYLATNDGIYMGEIDKNLVPTDAPLTRIAKVEIQGEIVAVGTQFELPYDQNDIVISARAVSLTNGKNAVVSYQINGEGGWQRMQGENLELPNLPSGKYEISFQSELLGVQQKGNTATLTFIIHPPFWRTWWFISLEILLALGIIALIVRAYLQSRARRENVARRLTQSRLTALRSQMNPHFIFNSLNSIQNFVANNDHQEAFLYLSRFGKLMRRVLDNSEHDMIPLEEEVDTLELYLQLEQLRSNNGFDFEIKIADELEPEFHEVPPTLIQPMLENAIWHGVMHRETKGKIWLEFSLEKDEAVVCRVRDNGVGREKASQLEASHKKDHKSKGLSITQERVALLNERLKSQMAMEIIDLFDEGGKPSGTEVVLRVPNKG